MSLQSNGNRNTLSIPDVIVVYNLYVEIINHGFDKYPSAAGLVHSTRHVFIAR